VALALFLHILSALVVASVVGRIYFAAVSKSSSSPKVLRWVGLALFCLITLGVWLRFIMNWGKTPALFSISSRGELFFALCAITLLILLVAGGIVRIIKAIYLEARRDYRRRETEREIRRRDTERFNTSSTVRYSDIEAGLDDLCREHTASIATARFQFLEPLALPICSGWVTPRIRCPLDMASGEGGFLLEIAALRELELLRKRVILWRAVLLALVILNPTGGFFVRGILLSLDFEADDAIAELGEAARLDLGALLEFQSRTAGTGRGEGLFETGAQGLQLRKQRYERESVLQVSWLNLSLSFLMTIIWGSSLVWFGPVSFDSIFGVARFRPPVYISVGNPQPGLVVEGIPDEGVILGKGKPTIPSIRDGVFADARKAPNGLYILGFNGAMIDGPGVTAQVEAIPGGGPRDTQVTPMALIYLSKRTFDKHVVKSMDVKHCQFIPLTPGVQSVLIPFSERGLLADAEFYLPSGWALRITNLRSDNRELGEQDPEETTRLIRASLEYESRWKKQRTSLEDALDWSFENVERQKGQ
jgi:hypothetical protein